MIEYQPEPDAHWIEVTISELLMIHVTRSSPSYKYRINNIIWMADESFTNEVIEELIKMRMWEKLQQ